MSQQEIDTLCEALRAQGLTWSQTNFAVSLVRNGAAAERELCARLLDNEADRQLAVWRQHIASGSAGPATSCHNTPRHYAAMIRGVVAVQTPAFAPRLTPVGAGDGNTYVLG